MKRIAGLALACALAATPAAADVIVKQRSSGKGGVGAAMSGEMVQSIKGTRMRSDQAIGGNESSTIFDVTARKMIVLNHKKKEADVYDMSKLSKEIPAAAGDIKATVTPTSETRQIAGATCTVHTMNVTIPMEMGTDKMEMTMAGPVCLARNAPGAAEYAAFYTAAAESGFFFTDPRAAKAQPGQAKGMTAWYREMSERGMPYSTELNMKFSGTGMMASMMNKMGGMSMTTEVTSISTEPVADAIFEVPTGYKVTTR
jgi:hypothetical protein